MTNQGLSSDTTVLLRNGTRISEDRLQTILLALENLRRQDSFAFGDLVSFARRAIPTPFDITEGTLKARSLLDETGHISDDVRNVVLSAVDGKRPVLWLINPRAHHLP